MAKIRVLIVDEAVVTRRLTANVLAADPDLEVAGTAPTGRIALAKMKSCFCIHQQYFCIS